MTRQASATRWLTTGSMLALLTLASMQAALPVVPDNVRSNARLRVEYGYCPGILVGLMNTDGLTYFCHGSVDLDGGSAVNEHTLFEMGSIGKVFTTTLLADMAQRGDLELTEAIQAYLPEGITAPTWFDQPITLTHLATHTSGLPANWTNLNPTDGNNPFAGYTTQLMYEFLGSYALTRAPGATYEYSNFAMGLLGQLLARKAGIGYEELVVTRIADELGLPDTRLQLTPDQQARLARGYSGVAIVRAGSDLGKRLGDGRLGISISLKGALSPLFGPLFFEFMRPDRAAILALCQGPTAILFRGRSTT